MNFCDWRLALTEAETWADRLGLDMTIRKVREYGRVKYAVGLASRNDSDYARAEIVRPAQYGLGNRQNEKD